MFLILLLPLAFYGIYEKLFSKCSSRARSLAGSLLIYEGITLTVANALSIGAHLNAATASVAWLLIVLVLYSLPRPDGEKGLILPLLKDRWNRIRKYCSSLPCRCRDFLHGCNSMEKILLALCFLLCLILLFLALLTPPSNYDSMTYHLARVAHWIDNGSVNYYLTNIDRQLFSPVLSEYNLLFMMLLSGTDSLLAMQQYLGMLLTAYFLYQILRRIGTSRAFSLFGVFMFLSMPLTVSQSITTQNDLGALLWYVIFLYYLLDFLAIPRLDSFPPLLMICIGASVGFAFLMKTSVCASMVMFMPWVLIVCIKRRDDIRALLLSGVTALLSMCVVISETLLRTYFATGSLLSSATSGDIMVATKNVKYIIVNLLKNYCLLITQHFWTALNGFIYRIPISLGRVLSVEVNNIAISFHGFDFITYLNTGDDMYSHDRTSSAFAAYLALIGGILLIILLIRKLVLSVRRTHVQGAVTATKTAAKNDVDSKTNSNTKKTSAARSGSKKSDVPVAVTHVNDPSLGFVISAWLGFGFIMALLRWQPWGSRLMYPALTIAAVSAVHMLDHCFSSRMKRKLPENEVADRQDQTDQQTQSDDRNQTNKGAFVCLLSMTALSILLVIRPLAYNGKLAAAYISSGFDPAKKEELLFDGHKHAYPAYIQIVTQLEKTDPKDIALIISGDGYDYPIWKMVRDRLPDARIRHIKADLEQGVILHTGDYTGDLAGISDSSSTEKNGAHTQTQRPADCIVCIESGGLQEGMTLDYNGIVYTCGFVADEPEVPAGIFYYDTQKNGKSGERLSAP